MLFHCDCYCLFQALLTCASEHKCLLGESHVPGMETGEIGQCEPMSLINELEAWWLGFLVLQCPIDGPCANCSGCPLAPASWAMVEDMLSMLHQVL